MDTVTLTKTLTKEERGAIRDNTPKINHDEIVYHYVFSLEKNNTLDFFVSINWIVKLI